jgi:hypothetical protein
MSFSKHLLSSAFLAGTIFLAATLPLTTLGSKPVAIQLDSKPVFTGQFREIAAPYLGLVLALSFGAGVTNLAMMRWLQSSRKLELAAAQLATLKQQLAEQEVLIEQLKFTPTRLQSSGLEQFLTDEGAEEERKVTRIQPHAKPALPLAETTVKRASHAESISVANGTSGKTHAQVAFNSRSYWI